MNNLEQAALSYFLNYIINLVEKNCFEKKSGKKKKKDVLEEVNNFSIFNKINIDKQKVSNTIDNMVDDLFNNK